MLVFFRSLATALKGLIGEDYADACGNETELLQKLNTSQFLAVSVPGHDHGVILTSHGQAATNQYLDPRGPRMLTVDHATGVRIDPFSTPPSSPLHSLSLTRSLTAVLL